MLACHVGRDVYIRSCQQLIIILYKMLYNYSHSSLLLYGHMLHAESAAFDLICTQDAWNFS